MSTIPTCAVRAVVNDSVGGNPVANVRVTAKLSSFEYFEGFVVPRQVIGVTDANGIATLNLFPNELGSASSFYEVSIAVAGGKTLKTVAVIPNLTECELAEVSEVPTYEGKPDGAVALAAVIAVGNTVKGYRDAAQTAQGGALAARDTAVAAVSTVATSLNAANAAKDAAVSQAAAAAGSAVAAQTAVDSGVAQVGAIVAETSGLITQANGLLIETSAFLESAEVALDAAPAAAAAAAQTVIDVGVNEATSQAALATSARVAAEAARDSVNTSGKVFTAAEGTVAGIAATTNGQQFAVLGADSASWSMYRNNAGTALAIGPGNYTKAYMDKAVAVAPTGRSRQPLVEDDDGNVPVWLEDGLLGAMGMTDPLIASVVSAAGLGQVASGNSFVPLVWDESENVPLWLNQGLLDAVGLGPQLLAVVAAAVQASGATRYAPKASPTASSLPILTDARALYAWRAALATYLRAGTGQARIMVAGDSWAGYTAIPQQLASLLYGLYAKSGEGWISVSGEATYAMNGIVVTLVGWTLYDASTGNVPTVGCGIDGHTISTTGTAATVSIPGITATNIDIYYRKTTGTFRYRIDGGAWTAITGDGSNTTGKVALAGLANAAHLVEIDTVGNAGTAVLYGLRATRPATPGIELLKAGNAGLRGSHLVNYIGGAEPAAIFSDILPHVVVWLLGTNDYSAAGGTVAAYIAGIAAAVSAIRAVSPRTGFVFVAPADTNRTPIVPLSDFRDGLYRWCIDNAHEFYNMNEDWSTWAVMNGLGMFADTSHVNTDGGYLTARGINKLLSP